MKTTVNSNGDVVIRPAMEGNTSETWKLLDNKVEKKEEGVQSKNSSIITMSPPNQNNHPDAPSRANTTTTTSNTTLLSSTLVVPIIIFEQNGTIHTNGTNTSTSAQNSKGNLLSFESDNETSIVTPKNKHNDSNNSKSRKAFAEFLSMEYVRDVAFATKVLETTQEVIARYMERQQQQEQNEYKRTACVYSAGLHDIEIANMTDVVYLENFKAMYTMMKDHCDTWIQLEQNANGFRFVNEKKSRRLFLWNEGIRRILRPEDYQIQLFERSLNARHGDNIHMDGDSFYGPLADFLFSLMNVADATD